MQRVYFYLYVRSEVLRPESILLIEALCKHGVGAFQSQSWEQNSQKSTGLNELEEKA